VLCVTLAQQGQIAPEDPSSPSLLGLSPPNPPSGEQSRGPPAHDRKLSAPLALPLAPSPLGRQAAFPQPGSLKPNPSFQLQLKRAPGQPSQGTRQPADLTVREFSLRSVPSRQSFQNKGQGEAATSSPSSWNLPFTGGQADLENKNHPS
jgi:hypothetical protein